MQRTYLGKLLIGADLLLLIPQFAFDSDIGKANAGLLVWFLGMTFALLISFMFSSTVDELGELQELKLNKFIIVFVVQIPIVLIISVVATLI